MDLILQADCVVTMCGEPLTPGYVIIQDTKIVEVGSGRHPQPSALFPDHLLMPGLINSHCHLDYTHFRGLVPPGKSFAEWIVRMNGMKRQFTQEDFRKSILAGLEMVIELGTTSLVNIESFPHLIPQGRPRARIWWAVEGIDIAAAFEFPETVGPYRAVSPHAPYTASPALYRAAKELARSQGHLITTHVEESADEVSLFRHATGPLFDLLAPLGRNMTDCGKRSSLEYLLEEDLLPDGALLVHGNYVKKELLPRLAEKRCAMVHCPQSHAFFSHERFPWEAYEEAGVPVLVGTDSLASGCTLNLLDDLRMIARAKPGMSLEKVLSLVTREAGAFLMPGSGLGTLRAGAPADMIALPLGSPHPYRSILSHHGPVPFSICAGEIVRQ